MTHTEYQEAKKAFRPYAKTAVLRQQIWNQLRENPDTTFDAQSLGKALHEIPSKISHCMRQLCLNGLAQRADDVTVAAPTKNKPDAVKVFPSVRFVAPWASVKKEW